MGGFQKPKQGSWSEIYWASAKLQLVVYVCLQDQSFYNFENDTTTLSVKEAKLTGL